MDITHIKYQFRSWSYLLNTCYQEPTSLGRLPWSYSNTEASCSNPDVSKRNSLRKKITNTNKEMQKCYNHRLVARGMRMGRGDGSTMSNFVVNVWGAFSKTIGLIFKPRPTNFFIFIGAYMLLSTSVKVEFWWELKSITIYIVLCKKKYQPIGKTSL